MYRWLELQLFLFMSRHTERFSDARVCVICRHIERSVHLWSAAGASQVEVVWPGFAVYIDLMSLLLRCKYCQRLCGIWLTAVCWHCVYVGGLSVCCEWFAAGLFVLHVICSPFCYVRLCQLLCRSHNISCVMMWNLTQSLSYWAYIHAFTVTGLVLSTWQRSLLMSYTLLCWNWWSDRLAGVINWPLSNIMSSLL